MMDLVEASTAGPSPTDSMPSTGSLGWDKAWVPGQVVWALQDGEKGWWPGVVAGPRVKRAIAGAQVLPDQAEKSLVRVRLFGKSAERESRGRHLLPFDDPRLPAGLIDAFAEALHRRGKNKMDQLIDAAREAKDHVAHQIREFGQGRGETWKDVCWRCDNGGDLICCDLCPGEYCFACVGITHGSVEGIGDWYCGRCRSVVSFLLGELLAMHSTKLNRSGPQVHHSLNSLKKLLRADRCGTLATFQGHLVAERDRSPAQGRGLRQMSLALEFMRQVLQESFSQLSPWGRSQPNREASSHSNMFSPSRKTSPSSNKRSRVDEEPASLLDLASTPDFTPPASSRKRVKHAEHGSISPGMKSALGERGLPLSSAASNPLITLHQNLLLLHSTPQASTPSPQAPSACRGMGRMNAIPIFPIPPASAPLSISLPMHRKGVHSPLQGVVPLLPRPSASPTHEANVFGGQLQPQHQQHQQHQHQHQHMPMARNQQRSQPPPPSSVPPFPGVSSGGSSSSSSGSAAQQNALPQPLEVHSVSVGPNGVVLALDEGRVMQLRRAEDLAPLYAHALAQLRAACDLLVVRDRELNALRMSSSASAGMNPPTSTGLPATGSGAIMGSGADALVPPSSSGQVRD